MGSNVGTGVGPIALLVGSGVGPLLVVGVALGADVGVFASVLERDLSPWRAEGVIVGCLACDGVKGLIIVGLPVAEMTTSIADGM